MRIPQHTSRVRHLELTQVGVRIVDTSDERGRGRVQRNHCLGGGCNCRSENRTRGGEDTPHDISWLEVLGDQALKLREGTAPLLNAWYVPSNSKRSIVDHFQSRGGHWYFKNSAADVCRTAFITLQSSTVLLHIPTVHFAGESGMFYHDRSRRSSN